MNSRQDYGLLKSPSVETARSGYDLLNSPLLNKSTAFSDEERDAFDLHVVLNPTNCSGLIAMFSGTLNPRRDRCHEAQAVQ